MANPIYRLQLWLETRGGQKFMNYAYSWGAAVVILGALFKLTHLPGANFWLFVGMGTEVFVFIIAGFDLSGIKARDPKRQAAIDAAAAAEEAEEAAAGNGAQSPGVVIAGGAPAQGGVVVIGGGGGGAAVSADSLPAGGAPAAAGSGIIGGGFIGGGGGIVGAPTDLSGLTENVDELQTANKAYVEQLTSLTETLQKVAEQAHRMSTDSAEMENLNRTLTGINTIYEMQLKSISTQVGTIDSINEQTRRMARQIEELNAIYARMIEAMTINMPGAARQ